MINTEKTAIQDEQQSHKIITNEIIKIIAKENLTIAEAQKLLYRTIDKINEQTVRESL